MNPQPQNLTGAASRAARIQIVRASCGVEAWLLEDYSVPLIAVDFSFHGGCAQDPLGKPGLGAFLAGMLDEGAGELDSLAFQNALEEDAIHLGYSCGRDHLSGRMQTLSRRADNAFALLAASVCAARLDPEPVERVRAQLIASYKRDLNDPDSVASRLFRKKAFGSHPYGAPAQGDLESLPLI